MNFFQEKHPWLFITITPIALLIPGFALTQPQRVDPLNPQIPVPKISYSSTFEGYTAYQEPKPLSWQDANAQVMQSKGHAHGGMEIMKGMNHGEATPLPKASSPATHPSPSPKESSMPEHHGSHHH
jgi:hypothetical protein